MNKKLLITGGYLLIPPLISFSSGYADFGSIFKKMKKTLGGSSGVSQNEIVDGLKEALEIGTDNTIQVLSQLNGYYGNPQLKIPLPQSFQKFEKILRSTGFSSELDAFDLSMNRAAEKAAPEAKALFVDAIKEITFTDADKILKGGENAPPLTLKTKQRADYRHCLNRSSNNP